jgi:hypothetical protein
MKLKQILIQAGESQHTTRILMVFVVISVGVIGVNLFKSSHAQSTYVAGSAVNGTLGGGAIKATDTNTTGGSDVQFGSAFYSGKFLGMNATLADTVSPEMPILQQLGVNSERGFIEYKGTSFTDPTFDGSIAKWLDTLTSAQVVPLPVLNASIAVNPTPNIYTEPTTWANAVVSWCQAYCAGGSFYANNPNANDYYAPHVLEMLNEPYGPWDRNGGVLHVDGTVPPADYASMLVDTRNALNSAGLSNITILGAADTSSSLGYTTNPETAADWTASVYTATVNGIKNAALNAIQGFAVHPYGDVNSTYPIYGPQFGWNSLQYLHSLYGKDIYVTEDGWCVGQTDYLPQYLVGGDCPQLLTGQFYPLTTQEANITYTINQLATVPWIKGYWYYNLHPFIICTDPVGGNNTSCNKGTWGSYSLYYPNGVASPAWTIFQKAAQMNGFLVVK